VDNSVAKNNSISRAWLMPALSLYVVTLIAQLANQSYLVFDQGESFLDVLLPSIVFLSVLTLPSLYIGFNLGRKLNLGIINHNSGNYASSSNGISFSIWWGLLLGAFLLALRWVLQPYLPAEIPDYGFRGLIGGFLVSIGAAIGEEVWFRFGMMTLLLYVYTKFSKRPKLSNGAAIIVILLVAFGFGLAHLPQLLSFGAGTSFAVWATILGNVAVGSLYGWCFWRYGLLSAITAHFSLDVVLHVVPALI
jgi:hypothetical protein